MWLALESNNSLIFSIVAVVAGIIPLIYEILNENAPADGVGCALIIGFHSNRAGCLGSR